MFFFWVFLMQCSLGFPKPTTFSLVQMTQIDAIHCVYFVYELLDLMLRGPLH
jgi:hypothetical protein